MEYLDLVNLFVVRNLQGGKNNGKVTIRSYYFEDRNFYHN
ncbi:hypothetical protein BH10BAC3_BH10BAC3_24170 [soil metagenome]